MAKEKNGQVELDPDELVYSRKEYDAQAEQLAATDAELTKAYDDDLIKTEQLAAANKEIERRREYAWHKPDCAVRAGEELRLRPDRNCDCGLVEILSKREKEGGDDD